MDLFYLQEVLAAKQRISQSYSRCRWNEAEKEIHLGVNRKKVIWSA